MTSPDIATQLLMARRAYLIAPAGYGKTHLIAEAVARNNEGVQLILTHTHAGVHALREKLRKFGVSQKRFRVYTIASWALHFAQCYPTLSGLPSDFLPSGETWNDVYDAGVEFLKRKVARIVLRASYTGVFVDEYQDCTLRQHQLVKALVEILPCRILGDPLQGIYGFRDNPVVDWDREVKPNFTPLPELQTPHRWLQRGANKKLGEWLVEVRHQLSEGKPVNLYSSPAAWARLTNESRVNVCRTIAQKQGTVAAIFRWRPEAYDLASKLSTYYTAPEEMDCQALIDGCQLIEAASGPARAVEVIKFAESCMVGVPKAFGSAKKAYFEERMPSPGKYKNDSRQVIEVLNSVASSEDLTPVLPALKAISQAVQRKKYRWDLWREMERALIEYQRGECPSLVEAARVVRDRTRMSGRQVGDRTASTTLLLKGLEFDHAIVLVNEKELDTKHLYVAMTRGAQSLTILSSNPILYPRT